MIQFLASIPSPPSDRISIGPLDFRFYGLMIALGVMAAVEMGRRRWEAVGGDEDDIVKIATWAVPAGLIGARLYHVTTDWKIYRGRWHEALYVWQGGLGIPGGLLLGVAVGVIVARRQKMNIRLVIDAVIPGIPVAQAIGRLGNWFNQEIFGKPTDVPWAVEIDEKFRPAEYITAPTFHPAFLYEALWNLALAGSLILIDRRKVLKPGQILPLWIVGYGVGRFIVEGIRIDDASLIWGIRVNHWVSGIAVVIGTIWFVWMGRTAPDSAESELLGDGDTPDSAESELLGDGDLDSSDVETEVGEVLDGLVVPAVEVVGTGDGGGSLGGSSSDDVGEAASDVGDIDVTPS